MWRDSRERSLYNFAGTSVVGTALGSLFEPRSFAGLLVKRLTIRNNSAATLTAGSLEYSPDNNTWLSYDGTTALNLGSASAVSFLIQNDPATFWRFRSSVGTTANANVNFWWEF